MSNAGILKEAGDANAVTTMTDNAVIRGAGGKEIQDSGVTLDDSDNLSGVNTLSVVDAATTRTNLGLGSISTQDSNSVAITGGSITAITDLAVADGGTGAGTAEDARTNLGLGTISVLNTPLVVGSGGSGRDTATAYAVICGGTTSTAAHQSITGVGTSGQVLTSNGASNLPTFQDAGGGALIQQVRTSTSALFDIGTAIPYDDTIPQKNEGDEILTLAITPTTDSTILLVEASLSGNMEDTNIKCTGALFRDDTNDAIAAVQIGRTITNASDQAISTYIRAWVTSGSTSLTTFKLRCGSDNTAGLSINGDDASRLYGGVSSTTLTITEFSA